MFMKNHNKNVLDHKVLVFTLVLIGCVLRLLLTVKKNFPLPAPFTLLPNFPPSLFLREIFSSPIIWAFVTPNKGRRWREERD